jgi:hypothetical protein
MHVRIHKAGNRAHDRWGRWENAALPKYRTWFDNRRKAGCAGNRDPGLEELASRRMFAMRLDIMCAPEMQRAGYMGPTAAIGELPSR